LIAVIGTGVVLAVPTGGGAPVIAAPIAGTILYSLSTSSGIVISTGSIIAIGTLSVLGLAILFALWKDYNVEILSINPWQVKLIRNKK
jgi:hypothetical protein